MIRENKKLLLVTYHFPPSIEVGGRRPAGIRKYLEKKGWQVYVVTEDPCRYPEGAVPRKDRGTERGGNGRGPIGEALGALRKHFPWKEEIRGFFEEMVYVPDNGIAWALRAIPRACRTIRENDIKVVYTTAPPHSANLVGWALKKRIPGIRWICEFRDLWTSDSGYRYRETRIRKRVDACLERSFFRTADRVIAVTGGLGKNLSRTHGREVPVIYNGYDREYYAGGSATRGDSAVFRILYCGSLYTGERDPEPLLRAAEAAIDRGEIRADGIRIDFYVQKYDQDSLETIRARMKYPDTLVIHDPVSYEAITKIQGDVECHIVINRDHVGEIGAIPAKIYEFMATGSPILVWDPGGSMREEMGYLGRYGGLHVVNDRETLGRCLVTLYKSWEEGRPERHLIGADFSQEYLAEQVERHIRELLAGESDKSVEIRHEVR